MKRNREKWVTLPSPEFNGRYQVSNTGKIRHSNNGWVKPPIRPGVFVLWLDLTQSIELRLLIDDGKGNKIGYFPFVDSKYVVVQ